MSESSRTDRWLRAVLAGPFEVVVDVAAWAAAATVAVYLRFDFEPAHANLVALAKFIPLTALAQCAIGLSVGLYRRRWRYGSFDEVKALAFTVFLATIVLYLIDRFYLGVPRYMPLSAVLHGGFVGLVLMAGARYVFRLLQERRRRPDGEGAARLLVFGAGRGGKQVISSIMETPDSPYLPVGLIDDNPDKRRLSIRGVPVLGPRADLDRIVADTGAEALLIATPSASSELVQELSSQAFGLGLDVKVLPTVQEMFGATPGVGDIRDVTEADLLGRHQIVTDVDSIAGYIRGKRVLVTGAGGSIGSELCRQLHLFAPAELMMLDRDESALHGVQLSIEGQALLDDPNLILADLRDEERIRELFRERRPDVVFHAAALKHLPLLEQYPAEAVKSNVVGSLTVLEAAAEAGVERFVNISTDKAANAVSILGLSKRVAERLTAGVSHRSSGVFLSVRFGNVLGSRGSVLTTFRQQIADGGPITVTDPDVTRYFMTLQEAVQLVIQAGAIGRDGEVLVLEMGKPVQIAKVAEQLAQASRRPVSIVFTGLRPGEKLHEDLFSDDEEDVRPVHPLISHVDVPPLDRSAIDGFAPPDRPDEVRQWLVDRCAAPADNAVPGRARPGLPHSERSQVPK